MSNSPIVKPMLAVDAKDLAKLRYPKLASPKLDGIRCLKKDGAALSRSFKPIANTHIRTWIERYLSDGLDGELMVAGTFQDVQSQIMSVGGQPNFQYWVFDLVSNLNIPFRDRFYALTAWYGRQVGLVPDFAKHVHIVPHYAVNSPEEVQELDEKFIADGFEGTMLRDPMGGYKCGRSTLKEELLLKIKQFLDAEGVVVGFEEQMSNQNEKTVNELGHSERSSHKAGMVPAGTLGKLLVECPLWPGERLPIGTGQGLTKELRQTIWDNKEEYLGKHVTFKYMPHGMKDLPRLPILKGFRHRDDMGGDL